jgi:hypothetical protein
MMISGFFIRVFRSDTDAQIAVASGRHKAKVWYAVAIGVFFLSFPQ